MASVTGPVEDEKAPGGGEGGEEKRCLELVEFIFDISFFLVSLFTFFFFF